MKRSASIAATLALAAGLAGCTSDDDTTPDPANTPGDETAGEDETTEPPDSGDDATEDEESATPDPDSDGDGEDPGTDDEQVDLTAFSTSPQQGEVSAPDGVPETVLTDLRHGVHEGYERLVFEFDSPPQTYHAEYVEEAVVGMEDVGDTTDHMEGYEVLQVRVTGLAHTGEDPGHRPDLARDEAWEPAQDSVVAEVMLGQLFEGQAEYFVGLHDEAEFHIWHDEEPDRIVIDIQTQ